MALEWIRKHSFYVLYFGSLQCSQRTDVLIWILVRPQSGLCRKFLDHYFFINHNRIYYSNCPLFLHLKQEYIYILKRRQYFTDIRFNLPYLSISEMAQCEMSVVFNTVTWPWSPYEDGQKKIPQTYLLVATWLPWLINPESHWHIQNKWDIIDVIVSGICG